MKTLRTSHRLVCNIYDASYFPYLYELLLSNLVHLKGHVDVRNNRVPTGRVKVV